MTLETETVMDRRLLRRRLGWWRGAAVVAALLAIGLLMVGPESVNVAGSRQIARVSIQGFITEDRDQLRMLRKIADDSRVAGVVLFVNSPGGTTAGGEALFDAIQNLAKKKPVVAQFGTVAASAAYIAGLATDRIVARGNSITGSVGVIFQWPEVVQLLDKLGVKVHELRSGPLKAVPSPFQPLDEAARASSERMVMETQRWFLGLVASRRGIDTGAVDGLEQGRVFTGREALTFKLVDQIGGEAEAVSWMEETRNVPKNLRVVDWKPQRDSDWGLGQLSLQSVARALGAGLSQGFADTVGDLSGSGTIMARLRLDGLVSVWQGSER
ncbi:MAG: signal peptide peptidase SppA [Hyphomicrobiaceae bacterium]|nr:signal peptide peptidase SppA [Hyphomicrobiaceae bacterium]